MKWRAACFSRELTPQSSQRPCLAPSQANLKNTTSSYPSGNSCSQRGWPVHRLVSDSNILASGTQTGSWGVTEKGTEMECCFGKHRKLRFMTQASSDAEWTRWPVGHHTLIPGTELLCIHRWCLHPPQSPWPPALATEWGTSTRVHSQSPIKIYARTAMWHQFLNAKKGVGILAKVIYLIIERRQSQLWW